MLWQLWCHCNPDHDKFSSTVVAIFPNVCLWRRSLCSNLVLTLKNCIEPPSYASTAYVVTIWPSLLFDSFVIIWDTCENFFGQMVQRPHWKKISHTPMTVRYLASQWIRAIQSLRISPFLVEVVFLLSTMYEWIRASFNVTMQVYTLGGVYMRKLARVWVSYRDDFLISYRVYMVKGHFISRLFEGTLQVDKIHVRFKIANLTYALPVQSTGRPISHQKGWSFRVYMITLRSLVPEWNSRSGTATGMNSRRGDSRRHDMLWWYHVNKYRAMRGNRSELAQARKSPRWHVITPLQ